MADTKYTILGMTGAGKTCFITGMYMRMSVGMDGFTLVTDDATRIKLERDIQALRRPSGQTRFPEATVNDIDAIKRYEFRMNYAREKIITFEMIDYAGGSLNAGGAVFEKVSQSIAESSALLIIIDGSLLCADSRDERRENVYFDCAMTITPVIQAFADKHPGEPLPPVVFIVTKSDLCKQYVQEGEIVSLIKEYFSPAFCENTTSYICAVSLGDTISDDDYKGKFNPINIHIPFFIGAYHDFYNRCLIQKEQMEEANAQLESERARKSSQYAHENRRWLFKRMDYMAKLQDDIEKNRAALNKNLSIFDLVKELFIKFGARLEMESSNFKCFIDGVEQTGFKSFRL